MKAIVFLADGFEECEALVVVDVLRRAEIETIMVSVSGRLEVDSSRHIIVKADAMAADVDYSSVDLIVLPGGRIGTEKLKQNDFVLEKCREFAGKKYIAAICAAPSILASLKILKDKKVTCHPDYEDQMTDAIITHESVATDENIITGQGLGASFDFAFEIIRELIGEEKVSQIKSAICYKK